MRIYKLSISDWSFSGNYRVYIGEREVIEHKMTYEFKGEYSRRMFKKNTLGSEIFLTKQEAIESAVKRCEKDRANYVKKIKTINIEINKLLKEQK